MCSCLQLGLCVCSCLSLQFSYGSPRKCSIRQA
uniref:Uncharacterized protein n=1 Tax=Rhizophora mucronata TaxID=61149 RepID=A0A2P2QTV7_RHIMU